MAERGWKQLLANHTWFHGKGKYPISAYSEYMPPPRLGRKAYGSIDPTLLADDDVWGWRVTEYEEAFEVQPGLALASSCGAHYCALPRSRTNPSPWWSDRRIGMHCSAPTCTMRQDACGKRKSAGRRRRRRSEPARRCMRRMGRPRRRRARGAVIWRSCSPPTVGSKKRSR